MCADWSEVRLGGITLGSAIWLFADVKLSKTSRRLEVLFNAPLAIKKLNVASETFPKFYLTQLINNTTGIGKLKQMNTPSREGRVFKRRTNFDLT